MPRILLTAAAALAAAVAVPSVAHGATLQQDGRTPHVDCGGQALWAAVDSDAEASVTGCAEVLT